MRAPRATTSIASRVASSVASSTVGPNPSTCTVPSTSMTGRATVRPLWSVMRARTDTQGRPAAVVGARLLYPNGLLQHAGVYFSRLNRGFAHRFNHGPGDLPEAQLPWERVAEMASVQGIDEADVVWDLAGGMPSKPARAAVATPPKTPSTRV